MSGPTPARLPQALEGFIGQIEQIPPAYSAVQVDGDRAYDLAREGVAMELKPRTVTIHAARLAPRLTPTTPSIEIECGKGTYVRALVRDLAARLGACAHVSDASPHAASAPLRRERGR